MRLSQLFTLVVASVASVSAHGAVLFEDDFESYTAGDPLPITGPWTGFSDIDSGAITVREDTVPIFGAGNQYLDYEDNNLDGSGGSVSDHPSVYGEFTGSSSEVFTASFDFYEPDLGPEGRFKLRFGEGSGSISTSSEIIYEIQLENGDVRGSWGLDNDNNVNDGDGVEDLVLTGMYSLDEVHHIDLITNLSDSPISYGGAQTLGAKGYDIWLDGVLIAQDVLFRRTSETEVNQVQIEGENNETQQMFVDNLVISDEVVLPEGVPEPSSIALVAAAIGSALLPRSRR
ncbi:PEP-CTERM sorting domain-containing protein [Aeoliella sp.]|uniref:PEP-CTERM sorting domain-containing protein n=1 Tax=Aeoliella sp. TaxID=2795800 RepID=UPI003CCC177F